MCLLLCLLMLPGIGLAEELTVSRFQGAVPPPDVPKGEKVPATYFDDAVFLGDSVMASLELHGFFPDSFYAVAIGIGPQNALGKVYDTLRGQMNLKELLEPVDFSKIYVLLGANTIDNMDSGAATTRYGSFLEKLVSAYPDKLVYVISIPPRKRNPKSDNLFPSPIRIGNFNNAIRELCQAHGIYYLDVFSRMLDDDGKVAEDHIGSDGLHLSRKGLELMSEHIMTHTVKERP